MLQARAGRAQLIVGIARVTHEFCSSLGQVSNEHGELGGIIPAGDPEAGEMVGHAAVVCIQGARHALAKYTEPAAYRAPGPGYAAGRERKIERPADPVDMKLFGEPRHGVQHGWQQVRVFVGVQMSRRYARVDDLYDLGAQFVVDAQTPQQKRPVQQAPFGNFFGFGNPPPRQFAPQPPRPVNPGAPRPPAAVGRSAEVPGNPTR